MKTHILCLGDSNTHGYCADPKDNADGGIRFNEDERWTCRLQTALGDKTAERLYELERIEGREEAVERLDDVLFHKIPYISDYI